MSGYQFLHLESYGFVQSKSPSRGSYKKQRHVEERKWTVQEVIDEAMRVEGACNHVKEPVQPEELVSVIPLKNLVTELEHRRDASTDPIGRKIRKDERLISSIPANNQKIIELFQKLQAIKLNKAPDYQRKKVWRRQHKIEFIDTILKNFPFPEIYVAPQKVDMQKLELTEQIVDGQQRLTTIQDYINGTDVFAQKTSITSFKDLTDGEKEDFLNYEVSVRYLKNATEDQIKEIFQRINRTDYALNRMERFHAIWGDSELVCLAKQITEKDLEINLDVIDYKVDPADRDWLVKFFVTGDEESNGLFSEAEVNRMLGLQYVLVLLVTLIRGEYFHRNSYIEESVKTYNEKVPNAALLISQLVETTKFISDLGLAEDSFWTNQSSLLTMIVEISKYDLSKIEKVALQAILSDLETSVKSGNASDPKAAEYYQLTREAVNAKKSREIRASYLGEILKKCITP